MLPTHELVILTKLRNSRARIVDFLLVLWFGPSLFFWDSLNLIVPYIHKNARWCKNSQTPDNHVRNAFNCHVDWSAVELKNISVPKVLHIFKTWYCIEKCDSDIFFLCLAIPFFYVSYQMLQYISAMWSSSNLE